MKMQTQILMIAMAVTFALALALTVALICMSYFQASDPIRGSESDTETPETLARRPQSGEKETNEDPQPKTDPEETARQTMAEPTPEGTLSFLPNGNGTCTLAGIGSCTDACVVIPERSPAGDTVTAIAERAFYGCAGVTAVQIPASVTQIGEYAFADCRNLVFFSVSPQNRYYCDQDGILYSADKTRLIQYPPMRAGSLVYLRAELASIAPMAFYNCAYLKTVSYAGDAAAWEEISIGSKNYSLTACSKLFSGGGK